ncbi:MAG: alpha/beta fold hydrolase [Deltaproteobacteria bacterium]|nr:alpha/beta fold hydrolase [Deltaproteobacteria bacterium]
MRHILYVAIAFFGFACVEEDVSKSPEPSAVVDEDSYFAIDDAVIISGPALLPAATIVDILPTPELIPFPPRIDAPYPIVLVHGFTGFTDLGPLEYFFGVKELLESLGTPTFTPAQPPYNSSEERSRVLAEHIDQILDDTWSEKVHVICHSQGGMDCRRLVSQLGYDDKIATLTTIATPHHGTPLADIALAAPDGVINPAGQMLGWLLGSLEGAPSDNAWDNDSEVTADAWDPHLSEAVVALSSQGAEDFNDAHPDVEGFPYFSVAAVSNLKRGGEICEGGLLFDKPNRFDSVDPLLVASGALISGSIFSPRRNDGLVPTDSMKWGMFLGCIPADHLDEIGQIADLLPGTISGFDHLLFYRDLHDFIRQWERDTYL